MSVKEKTKKDKGQSLSKSDYHEIILYNDDINTFDHVIKTLVKICNHTNHQAEQCTYLIHYKGKCSVKEGNNQKLIKLKEQIREEGLNAIIK